MDQRLHEEPRSDRRPVASRAEQAPLLGFALEDTTVKTNVLPSASTFVGRAHDVAVIDDAFLHGERLVSLVGPPGIGKTRLAREYALVRMAACRGGDVWCCDLTDAGDLAGLLRVVEAVLDVPPGAHAADRERSAWIGHVVAQRRPDLVILDNFEHLVDLAPLTVGRWVAQAPATRWLVTSREILRLPSELAVALAPLALPEDDGEEAVVGSPAVHLLLDRARRAGRRRGFSTADWNVLAAIARELDGIPLAIELAAPRLSIMEPASLLARLTRRFDLLARGVRGAPDRLETLRNAIDWSWNLLGPAERATFAQCSVFRGGFTLDAAEAVLEPPARPGAGSVLDLLHALVNKSLVHVEAAAPGAEPRFTLLLSLRDYAAGRLEESGEAQGTLVRHAHHYLEAAEAWARQPERLAARESIAWSAAEQDNLFTVIDRALSGALDPAAGSFALRALLALEPLLMTQQRLHGPAHVHVVTRVLDAVPEPQRSGILWARGLALRAILMLRGQRPHDAQSDIDRSLVIARAHGDLVLEGRLLRFQAMLLQIGNRLAEAKEVLASALVCHGAGGDRIHEALTLVMNGTVCRELLQLDEAREACARALVLLQAAPPQPATIHALTEQGAVLLDLGDTAGARALLEQAMSINRSLGEMWCTSRTLWQLGVADHLDDKLGEAERHLGEAARISSDLGNGHIEGLARCTLGLVRWERGGDAEARADLELSIAFLDRACNRAMEAVARAGLAALDAWAGRAQAAREGYARAEELVAPREGRGVIDAVRLLGAHLPLAGARAFESAGDSASASVARHAAHQIVASVVAPDRGAPGPAALVRVAARLLERVADVDVAFVSRGLADREVPSAPEGALLVARGGQWFRLPSGRVVRLGRRHKLRSMLVELLEHRLGAPGRAIPARALVAVVWQGERVEWSAAKNRLHVLLNSLRTEGLRDYLVARDDGYLLDARRLIIAADPAEALDE